MKEWLLSWNRDQVTSAAGVGLASILLLAGLLGGGPPGASEPFPEASARERRTVPLVHSRPLDPEFEKYWSGRNLFLTESASSLPIPAIVAPMPRPENLAVPLFRPSPSLDVYNRTAKMKYPAIQAKPLVPETDLPPPEGLDELKKIEEPPSKPFHDASEDRERELCEYFFVGDQTPRKGTCVGGGAGCGRSEEARDKVRIKRPDSNTIEDWPREKIREMRHSWRNVEQYEFRSKKLGRDPDARVELALWCQERGMLDSARKELEKSLETRRDHAKAIQLLGQLLEDQGNIDGAIAHYQLSAESASNLREWLWWRVGECLRRLELHEAALEAYGKSIVSPLSARGKVSQARAMVEVGRPAEAVEAVNDLFEKNRNDTVNFTAELRTQAHLARGRARLNLGEYAAAMADLETAAKAKSAEAWTALGACQAFEGRWKEAAASFAAALREDQYQLEAWTDLACIYLLAGKPGDAEALLGKAMVRDPVGPTVPACQAVAALQGGNEEGAAQRVAVALALHPGFVYAKYLESELALRRGDLASGSASSRSALREEPGFLPLYYTAGSSCLRTAEGEAAYAAGLASLLEAADRTASVLGHGWAEVVRLQWRSAPEAGRAAARESVTRAGVLFGALADLDPGRANLQIAMACVELLQRRPEGARSRLDRAKSLVRDAGLRSDPIVEYAFGYLAYHFGSEDAGHRLEAAQPYFKAAAEAQEYPDAGSTRFIQEGAAAMKKIREWSSTALVVDEGFNRDDSERVTGAGRGSWVEDDLRGGVPIVVRSGRCLFTGEPRVEWMPSRLERDNLAVDKFLRMEATFYPSAATFEFGVSVYGPKVQENSPRLGFHVAFDRSRWLRIARLDEGRFTAERREMTDSDWPMPTKRWQGSSEIRLRLERVSKGNQSTLEIQLYDSAKGAYDKVFEEVWSFQPAGQGRGLKVSVWARGEKRPAFTLALDDVKIYERRKP